jgi:hypothetical protein
MEVSILEHDLWAANHAAMVFTTTEIDLKGFLSTFTLKFLEPQTLFN